MNSNSILFKEILLTRGEFFYAGYVREETPSKKLKVMKKCAKNVM